MNKQHADGLFGGVQEPAETGKVVYSFDASEENSFLAGSSPLPDPPGSPLVLRLPEAFHCRRKGAAQTQWEFTKYHS